MMGVPIDGPSYVYGDNMSNPESTLKKKSNSIAYLLMREKLLLWTKCVLDTLILMKTMVTY
jgi:hypothetical protein